MPLDTVAEVIFRGSDGTQEVRRTRERATAVLAALPAREREVLQLRFLRGYSAAEVASALGLTAGNVRVLQHRALRRAAAALPAAALGIPAGNVKGGEHDGR